MHVVMSFMTSSWYMYTTQAYSSYSVYTRVRFVNARTPLKGWSLYNVKQLSWC